VDDPTLDLDYLEQIDVLDCWKNNSQRFSELALMVKDSLSILITTIAS